MCICIFIIHVNIFHEQSAIVFLFIAYLFFVLFEWNRIWKNTCQMHLKLLNLYQCGFSELYIYGYKCKIMETYTQKHKHLYDFILWLNTLLIHYTAHCWFIWIEACIRCNFIYDLRLHDKKKILTHTTTKMNQTIHIVYENTIIY